MCFITFSQEEKIELENSILCSCFFDFQYIIFFSLEKISFAKPIIIDCCTCLMQRIRIGYFINRFFHYNWFDEVASHLFLFSVCVSIHPFKTLCRHVTYWLAIEYHLYYLPITRLWVWLHLWVKHIISYSIIIECNCMSFFSLGADVIFPIEFSSIWIFILFYVHSHFYHRNWYWRATRHDNFRKKLQKKVAINYEFDITFQGL